LDFGGPFRFRGAAWRGFVAVFGFLSAADGARLGTWEQPVTFFLPGQVSFFLGHCTRRPRPTCAMWNGVSWPRGREFSQFPSPFFETLKRQPRGARARAQNLPSSLPSFDQLTGMCVRSNPSLCILRVW
jgi:hypothetical protein